MAARREGNRFVVDEPAEGSPLYNKGYFGTPRPGGGLELDLVEVAYLVQAEKLDVREGGEPLGLGDLLRIGDREFPGFEVRYLVYRDLRQRGYVVKPGVPPLDFRVFPRGGGPDTSPTKYWIRALSERAVFDLTELESHLEKVAHVRKDLVLAVVDEESDITYYRAARASPRGKLEERAAKAVEAEALFLRDRSVVLDPEEARRLYDEGFYGKLLGDRLQLSLLETVYLGQRGTLRVRRAETGRFLGAKTLLKEAEGVQPDFRLRLQVYRDLRGRGILVKTGFKYGAHFRGYEGDPEAHHAKYLIHALPADFTGMWPEISRAVRLAHGVRKELLLARPGEAVEYVRLRRIRP